MDGTNCWPAWVNLINFIVGCTVLAMVIADRRRK